MRQIEKLGNLYKKTHQSGMVYSVNGICPALCGGVIHMEYLLYWLKAKIQTMIARRISYTMTTMGEYAKTRILLVH